MTSAFDSISSPEIFSPSSPACVESPILVSSTLALPPASSASLLGSGTNTSPGSSAQGRSSQKEGVSFYSADALRRRLIRLDDTIPKIHGVASYFNSHAGRAEEMAHVWWQEFLIVLSVADPKQKLAFIFLLNQVIQDSIRINKEMVYLKAFGKYLLEAFVIAYEETEPARREKVTRVLSVLESKKMYHVDFCQSVREAIGGHNNRKESLKSRLKGLKEARNVSTDMIAQCTAITHSNEILAKANRLEDKLKKILDGDEKLLPQDLASLSDVEARAKLKEAIRLSDRLCDISEELQNQVAKRVECINFFEAFVTKLKMEGVKFDAALQVMNERKPVISAISERLGDYVASLPDPPPSNFSMSSPSRTTATDIVSSEAVDLLLSQVQNDLTGNHQSPELNHENEIIDQGDADASTTIPNPSGLQSDRRDRDATSASTEIKYGVIPSQPDPVVAQIQQKKAKKKQRLFEINSVLEKLISKKQRL